MKTVSVIMLVSVSVGLTVFLMSMNTSGEEYPPTHALREESAAAPPPPFAIDVALRTRYHEWASALSTKAGREGMGHTANVAEQVHWKSFIARTVGDGSCLSMCLLAG